MEILNFKIIMEIGLPENLNVKGEMLKRKNL